MIDPVKFKKILIAVLKLIILVELFSALSEALGDERWGRFIFDCIIAAVLYFTWDWLTAILRNKKQEYKRRIETAPHDIKLREAFIFSLLWSDEIYADIPVDRKRLVVISYTLIALGLGAAFLELGSGLMPLVVASALVLAAVNLLSWVVSLERSAKEALEVELKLAREVQSSLLPLNPPCCSGLRYRRKDDPRGNGGRRLFRFHSVGQQ